MNFYQDFLEQLEYGDVCAFAFVLLILGWAAGFVTKWCPESVEWGQRAGFATFLIWIVRDVWSYGFEFSQLARAALRGMLIAVLVAELCLLLGPVVKAIVLRPRQLIQKRAKQWQTSRAARATAERQDHHVIAAQMSSEVAEPENSAAELERRRQAEDEAKAARRTRENAHFEVRVLYERYRAELADKLPEEKFQALLRDFLGETQPADEVVIRAEALKQMLRDRLNLTPSERPPFQTLEEIAAAFRAKRDLLAATEFSADIKDTLLIQLRRDEQGAIQEFLKCQ